MPIGAKPEEPQIEAASLLDRGLIALRFRQGIGSVSARNREPAVVGIDQLEEVAAHEMRCRLEDARPASLHTHRG